ncbi:MAG TPA: hypothetical protein VI524_04650, partial [Anaerolineales bacterium]|nr:hypothetical protein [Anaerolineales bacterium]
GLARSSLMDETSALMRFLVWLGSAPVERRTGDIIRVAVDPEFEKVTDRFFHKAKEIEAAAYARNAEAQKQLWEVSRNLVGAHEVEIPPQLTM